MLDRLAKARAAVICFSVLIVVSFSLKGRGIEFRDGGQGGMGAGAVLLRAAATGHADGADHFALGSQGQAAAQQHSSGTVVKLAMSGLPRAATASAWVSFFVDRAV